MHDVMGIRVVPKQREAFAYKQQSLFHLETRQFVFGYSNGTCIPSKSKSIFEFISCQFKA